MPTDESRKSLGGGAAARGSRSALGPMVAPRAPLMSENGTRAASLLAPQLARLEDELSMVRKSLRAQRAETRVEKQTNALLRAELQALKSRNAQRHDDPASAGAEVERAMQTHREEMDQLRTQYETRALDLETRCAQELALWEEKHAAKMNALRNSLRAAEELTLAKTERIRRLEARLSRIQAGEAEVQALNNPSDLTDDLTMLRGVGPVYALALRRHGVVTLAQIAAWTLEDIRALAPKIGTTEARIFREGWVIQARKFGTE